MADFALSIRRSVSAKLLVLLMLVLIVTVLLILLPLRVRMREQVVGDLQNELRAIAITAAMHIDGDALSRVQLPADASGRDFLRLRNQLRGVRDLNADLTQDNIYTVFRDDFGVIRFGVMTHENPFIGDVCPVQPELVEAMESATPQVTDLYRDLNGQWISAFSPILDSRGSVVGAIDVNRKSDKYFERYHRITRLTLAIGLLVLALSLLLGWLVLNRVVVRPMRAVHGGMQALRRSDFGHRISLSTGDEFEQLGDTFNNLARELNAARNVQASFAPKDIPSRGGWAIAAVSEPCDATAGDYVDAFALPDDRIAVVVADVTGHGLAPALLMSACRSTLRALAALESSPAKIIERLDAMISDDLTDGRFITMIFGILASDGQFTFCNAGHGPAMAFIDGRVITLEAHRPPVGIGWQTTPDDSESSMNLRKGDRLLLASDGVTEAFDPSDEQFGEDRLRAIAGDRAMDQTGVIRTILDAVVRHRGRRAQSDDITILCIDRTDVPGSGVAGAATSAVHLAS